MRIPHYLVRSPSGIYHFRLKVPRCLHEAWGLRVIKQSLRTASLPLARGQAFVLAVHYAQAFAMARGGAMSKPPSLEDILAGMGQTRRFEADFDPLTGRPTRIKTDGSAQDNAAALSFAKIAFAHDVGNPGAPLGVTLPTTLTPKPARAGMTLGEALKVYEATEAPDQNRDTWDARQRAFASFVAFVEPQTRVSAIERATAAAWAHGMMAEGRTKRTTANYVSHVAQLFEMLIARGEIERGQNPVKGVVVMSKKEKTSRKRAGHEWEAFELPALRQLFHPDNYIKLTSAHARWAPLIGLYTGARVGELAQLYLRDFEMRGRQPCLLIREDSDGQSLKTEHSRRLVPLHPMLVELGLMAYVKRLRKQGHERLFPDMRIDSLAGAGNAISKAWTYYLRQLGVEPRREHGRIGFHSLRKNVVQALQGHVDPERRRAFVGHEKGDEDVHEQAYMRPWTAKELGALFPSLTWGSWLDVAGLKACLAAPVWGETRGERA